MSSRESLNTRIAVIGGAGSGIGAAIAHDSGCRSGAAEHSHDAQKQQQAQGAIRESKITIRNVIALSSVETRCESSLEVFQD